MAVPVVHRFSAAAGSAPEEYFLPAERLLQGNPKQTVWMHYTCVSGKFTSGIWASERGCWRIRYTEEEYCRILEGESVITDAAGIAVTVRAGEEFVIPSGFVGTWEVVQPTRKRFVIYEPGTAQGPSAGP